MTDCISYILIRVIRVNSWAASRVRNSHSRTLAATRKSNRRGRGCARMPRTTLTGNIGLLLTQAQAAKLRSVRRKWREHDSLVCNLRESIDAAADYVLGGSFDSHGGPGRCRGRRLAGLSRAER